MPKAAFSFFWFNFAHMYFCMTIVGFSCCTVIWFQPTFAPVMWLASNVVLEMRMTYNMSSGTLTSTKPNHTIRFQRPGINALVCFPLLSLKHRSTHFNVIGFGICCHFVLYNSVCVQVTVQCIAIVISLDCQQQNWIRQWVDEKMWCFCSSGEYFAVVSFWDTLLQYCHRNSTGLAVSVPRSFCLLPSASAAW